MRLPHTFLAQLCFGFASPDELVRALGSLVDPTEIDAINRLCEKNLPPVTSPRALAVMLGVNEGLIWSMINRQDRYYRTFLIPKGQGSRKITAPRAALKVIQKWLSVRLQESYKRPPHVFGFVPGFSHIHAAKQHLGAGWVQSFDIENFFPSTPEMLVVQRLVELGYPERGASVIGRLACVSRRLAQGAPTSPLLSNLAFSEVDQELASLAARLGLRLTRYADDIVFSGVGGVPSSLLGDVHSIFKNGPWTLSPEKTELVELPNRLKIHGLLVHGGSVRLTKGYRNRIRAYQHLLDSGRIDEADLPRIRGHMAYAESIKKMDADQDA